MARFSGAVPVTEGEPGPQGLPGPRGLKGDTGPAGTDGADASFEIGTVTTTTITENRVNLVTNPNFETGISGWSYLQDNFLQTTSTYAFSGTKSLDQLAFYPNDGVTTVPDIAVTVGETYTASAYVYLETTASVTFQAGGSTSTATIVGGVWTRMSTTFTASSTTANISVYFPSATGIHIYVDAVMLEEGSALNPYFDGSSPGAAWTGTPNESTSYLTAPLVIVENVGTELNAVLNFTFNFAS